jgi:hypothetical protein
LTPMPPSTVRAALRRSGLLLAAVALVAACTSTPAPTPGISLGVSDPTPSAIRGESIVVTVSLTRSGGADADVVLSVSGLPTDVTAAFAPASLSGSATESVLTLTVDASASEGTADLTVTGTAGTLTDDADLTLSIESLTITGRVEQSLRQPIIGAAVTSQGETTFTDAAGAFTLSGLSLPYDLVVSSAAGSGGLHVFEGMTSPTPLLRPTFAALDFVGPGFGATVNGTLIDGALGADEVVTVCLEGIAVAVFGCDMLGSGDAAFSIFASWFAPADVSVRLHALQYEVDVDGLPTTYLGYETILLNLTDGGVTLADLDFDPVGTDSLTGTRSNPVSLPDTDMLVYARFGPNLSMPLAEVSDPSASFSVPVPVIAGVSYDVVFAAGSTDEFVLTWRHDVGLDAGALAVATNAQLVAPADATTGVDLTTPFASTAAGDARTYFWSPIGANVFIGLTTSRTSVTIPNPALGGFAVPAGADYTWSVLGHGDDGVDVAATGGFADYFSLLYTLFGAAGPGFDGDRTLAFAAEERGFTFAP